MSGTPTLLPDPLPADPMPLFLEWFERAHAEKIQPNPNAMTLATVQPDGRPAARVVLCKGVDVRRGGLEFFSNYNSRKGVALAANPDAAAGFLWDAMERQARFEGCVVRLTATESDAYFRSRPLMSRLGAWASEQSHPIESRADLLAKLEGVMRRFGLDPANPPGPGVDVDVPRPEHWGGYRLIARRVELWVGVRARIHDCAQWVRPVTVHADEEPETGAWISTRLQP